MYFFQIKVLDVATFFFILGYIPYLLSSVGLGYELEQGKILS